MTDVPATQHVSNIGEREIAKRRWIGIASVAMCLLLEIVFVINDSPRWWRLAFLPLLYLGISGILQAHEKT